MYASLLRASTLALPAFSLHRWALIGLIAALLTLGACSTVPRSDIPASDSGDGVWKAEGKLGIRSQNKAQSANFIWENRNRDYRIELFGPFGQGRVRIEKTGGDVALSYKGQQTRAASAQELLFLETGIVMPVHWLRSWINGIPSNETPAAKARFDSENTLMQFQQSDWLVTYLRHEFIQDQKLPTKMTLQHADYTLTIIVKSRQL